jgi:MFS transporter, Spinster family, sphingosine-1-phosphate transporter
MPLNRKLSPGWLLFILTGLNLLNYVDRYVLSAVLSPIKADFGLNDGNLGRINTIFMVGYFVTSPIFGYLGDRASRKWLIAAGIFVWSLGTVLTGYAATFALLLLFRVLVGVGEASYATISPSLISDTYPPGRRNNALTIFYTAIPIGAALGNILGGHVAATWSWRAAFIWAGLPGLLLATVLLPFAEPQRGSAEGRVNTEKPKPTDVFKLFTIPDYQLVIWGYTAYTFALGAFAVWGPTYLHRIHHIPNEQAATFFGGVLVVAGLLGTLVGGFAATAWRKTNPAGYAWTLTLSVMLAAPMAVLAFVTVSPTLSMACLATTMFLVFLCTGPVNTLILETVPLNLRASAMAVSIFIIHLFGDMWSPEIIGRASDRWQSLQKAVLILPGALLVCALLWIWLAIKTSRARPPVAT